MSTRADGQVLTDNEREQGWGWVSLHSDWSTTMLQEAALVHRARTRYPRIMQDPQDPGEYAVKSKTVKIIQTDRVSRHGPRSARSMSPRPRMPDDPRDHNGAT